VKFKWHLAARRVVHSYMNKNQTNNKDGGKSRSDKAITTQRTRHII